MLRDKAAGTIGHDNNPQPTGLSATRQISCGSGLVYDRECCMVGSTAWRGDRDSASLCFHLSPLHPGALARAERKLYASH